MSKVLTIQKMESKGEAKAWTDQLINDGCTFTHYRKDGSIFIKITWSPTFAVNYLVERCKANWWNVQNSMPGQSINSSPEDYS